MSIASRTGQVVFLQNGGTTSGFIQCSIGDIFQYYAGTADAPTDIYPDFPTVQPVLQAVFTSSKKATGYVTPNDMTWSFNGTALTFGTDGVSTNTLGGETGHFKKLLPEAGKRDFYGLQIVKNLVKAGGAAPCRIDGVATFVGTAGNSTVRVSVTVPISMRVGDSNIVTIRPGDDKYFTIQEKGGSCKLKAVAVRGNSEVTSGLTYEWSQLQGDGTYKTLTETGDTLTVTGDMVSMHGEFRVKVLQNGSAFGYDSQMVADISDPYDILPNPTPGDETITDDDPARSSVVYRPKLVKRGSTEDVNAAMKYLMVFMDSEGNVLNTATATTPAKEFTCTLAMCQQAGGAGPRYMISTES